MMETTYCLQSLQYALFGPLQKEFADSSYKGCIGKRDLMWEDGFKKCYNCRLAIRTYLKVTRHQK